MEEQLFQQRPLFEHPVIPVQKHLLFRGKPIAFTFPQGTDRLGVELRIIDGFYPDHPLHLHPDKTAAAGGIGQQRERIGGCDKRSEPPHLLHALAIRLAQRHFRLLKQVFQIRLTGSGYRVELIQVDQRETVQRHLRILPASQVDPIDIVRSQFGRQKTLAKRTLAATLRPDQQG